MKKRRVLKGWVKVVLNSMILGLCVIAIVVLLNVDSKLTKDFVKNCEAQGYSTNYCIAHS